MGRAGLENDGQENRAATMEQTSPRKNLAANASRKPQGGYGVENKGALVGCFALRFK